MTRSPSTTIVLISRFLPPPPTSQNLAQWSPVTTRSPLSQTQLPLDPQEGPSSDITQSPPPLPEHLAQAPGSSTTSRLPGMAKGMRSSTLTGWVPWAPLAKNHCCIGRPLCQRGITNAVSLSSSAYATIYPPDDDLADRSDSLGYPVRRNLDPAHTQQSLYHRGPRRRRRRLGPFGARGARPPPRGR